MVDDFVGSMLFESFCNSFMPCPQLNLATIALLHPASLCLVTVSFSYEYLCLLSDLLTPLNFFSAVHFSCFPSCLVHFFLTVVPQKLRFDFGYAFFIDGFFFSIDVILSPLVLFFYVSSGI
jgi:hypothetical protein